LLSHQVTVKVLVGIVSRAVSLEGEKEACQKLEASRGKCLAFQFLARKIWSIWQC